MRAKSDSMDHHGRNSPRAGGGQPLCLQQTEEHVHLLTEPGMLRKSGWGGGGHRKRGAGSDTAADVLAWRESSRECAVGWGTGGLGSIQNSAAPFQT